MILEFPPFVKYAQALKAAGVETGSPRGFWGGRTKEGDIVVTTWIDEHRKEDDTFQIHRPQTRHGGLLDMWDMGRISPNATVRLILLRKRPKKDPKEQNRVHSAALLPGRWKVIEVEGAHAFVKPI